MLALTSAQMLKVRVSEDRAHVIRPRLLTDGRLGCSEVTLVDPAHEEHWPVLQQGEVVPAGSFASVPITGEFFLVDGKRVRINADDRSWSVQATASGHRFEVRAGDDAAENQRSELAGTQDRYGAGVELWQSWTTEINVRDDFERMQQGGWGIFSQWQAIDTSNPGALSPPIAFDYGNNAFTITTRSDAEYSGGFAVPKLRFSDALPAGPVNYVCRLILGANGELQVWRNGSEIVNIAAPIAYYNFAGDLAQLQWGLYRKRSTVVSAVTTSNMRWGLTDLSDKILNPDPV